MGRMKPKHEPLPDFVRLRCPYCGKTGSIAMDGGGGEHQVYVEDCPACCRPRVVHVEPACEPGATPHVWLERDDGQ